MTTPAVPLDDLAGRINAEHEACVEAARSALGHAIEAGRMLAEAKTSLPHGAFLPWVREHCAFGERMAQRYMKAARWRELNPTRETDLLSLRDVMAEVATPKAAGPETEAEAAAKPPPMGEAEARETLAAIEARIEAGMSRANEVAAWALDLIRREGREKAVPTILEADPDGNLLLAADALAGGAHRYEVAAFVWSGEGGSDEDTARAEEWERRIREINRASADLMDRLRRMDEAVAAGLAGGREALQEYLAIRDEAADHREDAAGITLAVERRLGEMLTNVN